MKNNHWYILIFLASLLIIGCNSEVSYQDWLKQEKESDVQNDSLFLGYYFGMDNQEFKDLSWEMNRQGLMSGLTKINYEFDDLGEKAIMSFWPNFVDGKLSTIPIEVSYNAWAPWNQELWAEPLMEDLVDWYTDLYDTQFRYIYVPEIEKNAFVSIDGNREIRISRINDQLVKLDFIDHNTYQSIPNR